MRHLVLGFIAVAVLLVGCSQVRKIATDVAADQGMITEDDAASINRASDAIEAAYQDLTPEQEYYIGRAVAASLLEKYAPLDDLPANQYVNELGQSLAFLSDRPETFGGYRFLLLDSDEINAFACPGGLVLVTRGLVQCCPDEDALAAVLAHEIAHVAGKHGLKAIKKGRLVSALAILSGETASQLGSEQLRELAATLENAVEDILDVLMNRGYARELEQEADAAALDLVVRTGYDGHGLEVMLTEMDRRWSPSGPGFLSTHPAPEDRLQSLAPNLPGEASTTAPAERQARFTTALDGVI